MLRCRATQRNGDRRDENRSVWGVLNDERTGTDSHVVADRDRPHHTGICAEKDVVSDANLAVIERLATADSVPADEHEILSGNGLAGDDNTKRRMQHTQATIDRCLVVDLATSGPRTHQIQEW